MTTRHSIVLGIDISKNSLDAHLLPDGHSWHVKTDPTSLAKWVKQLPDGIDIAVMEATGRYHNIPAAALAKANIPIAIVNPKRVKGFAKALGQQAKTDAVDARTIAQFGLAVQPTPRPLPDETQALLAELVTRRHQLLETRKAEECRLKTTTARLICRNIVTSIRWLNKQIKKIEQQIDEQIQNSPIWLVNRELLLSVPGIGPVNAYALIALLPELGTLSGGEIAALLGVAPFPNESGKWKGKRFIRGGRANIRAIFFPAALAASRCNPILREFYQRLLDKGKAKKVALTALMRRLIVILNAIIRDQKTWKDCSIKP